MLPYVPECQERRVNLLFSVIMAVGYFYQLHFTSINLDLSKYISVKLYGMVIALYIQCSGNVDDNLTNQLTNL